MVFELVGPYEHTQALQDGLRELLGRIRLVAVFRDEPSRGPVLGHVRIDFTADDIVVTAEDARHRGPPVRRIVSRGDASNIVRETLAHVVLGAVEPLALGPDPSSPPGARPPPPPPAPPPPPGSPPAPAGATAATTAATTAGATTATKRPPDSAGPRKSDSAGGVGIWVTVGGGPRAWSSDRLAPWLGGGALLTFPGVLEPSCFLEGGYLTPVWIERNALEAVLSGATLRAGMRVAALSNRRLALDAGVASGVDVLSLGRTDSQASDRPVASSTLVQPIVGGLVGLRARVSRNFFLRFEVGADVDLAPKYWVAVRHGVDVPFFELERVRPFAQIGLELGVLGRQAADATESTP